MGHAPQPPGQPAGQPHPAEVVWVGGARVAVRRRRVEEAPARVVLAAGALGEFGSPDGLAPLTHAIGDEMAMVRGVAAGSLGKLGLKDSRPLLQALTRDPSLQVRAAASEGLLKLGDTSALLLAADLARNPDPSIRAAAPRCEDLPGQPGGRGEDDSGGDTAAWQVAQEKLVRDAEGSDHEDPAERVSRAEQVALIQSAIAGMNPADRTIIELRHTAGLSFAEIAENLGEPLGTVLARGHRALAKLKKLVAGEEEEVRSEE